MDVERRKIAVDACLLYTSASLKKDKIPHKTISDFLKYLPYKDKIIEYGKKAILGNHDDRSNIDIDDAIAYHGIGLYDLCLEYGEENGWQRFEEKGRKVFCPIKSMEIIVRAISPDLLIIPTGVRFEKALAKVANLNNIPVVYINDLPTSRRSPGSRRERPASGRNRQGRPCPSP